MVFWAAPVITVKGLSFTSGVVVAACWVVVSSMAAVKIVAGAAVTFSNTLSRVVSLTSDITGEAFVTTLSVVFVNPGVDLIDLLFHFCVVLNDLHEEGSTVFTVSFILPELSNFGFSILGDLFNAEGIFI